MFKKILAAVSAFAISLGMVVLIASPASATPPSTDPNDVQKVVICHYDNGQGGKWTTNDVSVSSIINVPNGHDFDENDIIPPFDYADGSYGGKNWDAYGQWVYYNGCSDEVTPLAVTFQQAVCDTEEIGEIIGGGYTIPVIPVGVIYTVTLNDVESTGTAGFHPLAIGDVVSVVATAAEGYSLPKQGDWDWGPWTVTDPGPCDLVTEPLVTPVVTFVQETCDVKGSYTLATEEGTLDAVNWTVSGGLPNSEGKHFVATAGIVEITAAPADGYGFAGEVPLLDWSYEFKTPADCDLKTLALTGASPAEGLGLAGMLLLGGALIVMARQRRVLIED